MRSDIACSRNLTLVSTRKSWPLDEIAMTQVEMFRYFVAGIDQLMTRADRERLEMFDVCQKKPNLFTRAGNYNDPHARGFSLCI